jgi:hypothetical protein
LAKSLAGGIGKKGTDYEFVKMITSPNHSSFVNSCAIVMCAAIQIGKDRQFYNLKEHQSCQVM